MKFHHLPAGGAQPLGRAMPAAEMNPGELLEKAWCWGRRGAWAGGALEQEGRGVKAREGPQRQMQSKRSRNGVEASETNAQRIKNVETPQHSRKCGFQELL